MAVDEDRGTPRVRNVGGVHVEVYDDGHIGIDEKRLGRDVHHKINMAIGQSIWGCVFTICFVVFVVGILVGTGWYVWVNFETPSSLKTTGQETATSWSGATPLTCSGNDKILVNGVTARLPGKTAIVATSNCNLTVENSTIEGAIAIKAEGNAKVIVEGGSLTGKPNAIQSSANSNVELSGVKVTGKKKSSGNSKIVGE